MDRREFLRLSAGAAALSMAGSAARAASDGSKKPVEDTPVVLECAISGSTTKAKNPAVPETVEEHIAEIGKCFDAGATIVHSHSNQPNPDPKVAAQFYLDTFGPVRKKHPHGIVYATANFDPKTYGEIRQVWPSEVQCGHHRILAEAGAANMVLLDTGVAALGGYDEKGVPSDKGFFWYGFWPEDTRIILDICKKHGTGTSISVFEPGWMKNVIAMARGGSLPRGSKLNIYFGGDGLSSLAPPIPEALELYLKMMEGLDDGGTRPQVVRRRDGDPERHGHAAGAHGPGARRKLPGRHRGLGDGAQQRGADRPRQGDHRIGGPTRHQRRRGHRVSGHSVRGDAALRRGRPRIHRNREERTWDRTATRATPRA
jgi:hypothetical protein